MKRTLLSILTLFYFCIINAQIQNTEVLFYIGKDCSTTNLDISIYVMRWVNGTIYVPKDKHWVDNLRKVVENLNSDYNFYENLEWRSDDAEIKWYDAKMSNDKWYVYAKPFEAWIFCGNLMHPKHTRYYAFKRDLSEYMKWSEPDYDDKGRYTYRRLTKSELRSINVKHRDFLQ